MKENQEKLPAASTGILASGLRWLGLASAAIWMLMAVTGMMLSYSFEINDSLISSAKAPTDLAAIEKRMSDIKAEGGKANVNWIWSTAGLPGRFLLNFTNSKGEVRMARIAGDGSILKETGETEFTFLEKVRDVHLTLAGGKTGEWILTITGLLLLGNLVLAFFQALRRNGVWAAAIKPVANEDRVRSWYRSLSLWGAVPAFVVVLAAITVHFEHSIEGPIGAPPIKPPAIAATGDPIGFAAAAHAAEAAIPGSRFVGGPMATTDNASYNLWVNQPGEFFRPEGYGGSLVSVNANDGSIRGSWPLQQASTAYKAIALPYPVHTGEIAGPIGRVLVLLTGLWLLVWSALRLRLLWRREAPQN
jgi:uncharacterized iron-regulated membrane protein